ncbi:V-set and immunoglobulin domain-containing protein 4-like [Lonchura striata]
MGSATLPCTYVPSEGFTQQTLRWSVERDSSIATVFRRDGSGDHILLSKFRGRVSVPKHSPGDASLLIQNLEMLDSGHYTCQITWRSTDNSLITKEVTTTVKVVKVEPMMFELIPRSGSVQATNISVVQQGGDVGAELLPPGRHRQQERELLCRGDRPQQSQPSVTWAPVLCLPVAATKPIIRAAEPGLTLPAGASASLTCEAGGSPPISYRWFRSAAAGTAELLSSGAELAWPSLRPSDSGTYFCEAQNRAGAGAVQRSDAVQLTVTGTALF